MFCRTAVLEVRHRYGKYCKHPAVPPPHRGAGVRHGK
jgi:hypothetical protein